MRVHHRAGCLVCAVLLASCIGGQTGTPTSGRSSSPHDAGSACDPTANAPQVRGNDLYEQYATSYYVDTRVSRGLEDAAWASKPLRFEVTVEPYRALLAREPVACDQIAVPVLVTIESDDGELRDTLRGQLSWQSAAGQAEFRSEYTRGREPPLVSGRLRIAERATLAMDWETASDTLTILPVTE